MRPLFISVLCLLIPVISFSQVKTDLDREGLKGAVQTVRVSKMTTLDENGKQSVSPLLATHVVTYDRSGKRTEVALYDRFGILNRRIVYTFDPETGKRNGLITYDAQNSMVRKVTDITGSSGFKKTRTIQDFNEDGSLYRKTEVMFDDLGDIVEVAEYQSDGSLIKKDRAPLKESQPALDAVAQRSPSEDADPVVSFGVGAIGEDLESDAFGNWTRKMTKTSSRTYASGKKTHTSEMIYREFTYYRN